MKLLNHTSTNIRINRRFVPTGLSEADARLEARVFAAFFYRTPFPAFAIDAFVADRGAGVDNPQDFQSNAQTALAAVSANDTDGQRKWGISETSENQIIDSNSATASATDTVQIKVAHLDQGLLSPDNTQATGNIVPVYNSVATSGLNSNGTVNALTWVLTDPVPGDGGPDIVRATGTNTIEAIVSINYMGANPVLSSVPTLTFASNVINVTVNSNVGGVGGPGLTIADSTNLSAPPTILYQDASFGAPGSTSGTTQDFVLPIPPGPFVLNATYGSALVSRPLALRADPFGPDETWYQDQFNWNVAFHNPQ